LIWIIETKNATAVIPPKHPKQRTWSYLRRIMQVAIETRKKFSIAMRTLVMRKEADTGLP
jgi:hypothetical protein